MPSSIKLSVFLTERTEDHLGTVGWLKEPWQDIMKDMMFVSPKDSMDMGNVASQVEAYIERIIRHRYGEQLDKVDLDFRVYQMMDAAGTKKFDLRSPVSECLKPNDTVLVDVQAKITQSQQKDEISDEIIEKIRSMLRFGLNDRVLCYCGPRWLSGHIVGTAVPDDDTVHAYLVKTDALAGLPSRTISVPRDRDDICTQEICFDPAAQLHLVRAAASPVVEAKKRNLRFELGHEVACRIQKDAEDDLEKWVTGKITEVWPKIEDATFDMAGVSGSFPNMLPYKIELASGKWVYCHRDDHTLIRRVGMQPVTRVKGISKRIEIVKEADGSRVCIDHVTGRRKRMAADDSDSE